MAHFFPASSKSAPIVLSRRVALRAATAAAGSLVLPTRLLAKSLTLKLNYFGNYKPYSFIKPDGSMEGMFVDGLNEVLGRRGGIALAHRGLPWARAQQEVKDGRADAFCTLETDLRNEYANFSRETLYEVGIVLCFAKANPKADKIRQATTIEDLRPFSIGTYIGDSRIHTFFKGLNVNTVPDMQQALMKIGAVRTDLAVMTAPLLDSEARSLGIREQLEILPFTAIPPDSFRLGIRKTYADGPEILALFDKLVVAARADGVLEKILASYS